MPPEILFANAPPDEREAALGDRLGADGRVAAPYNCLLPLHAEHPHWSMQFDADQALTLETRMRLLGRAADEGLVVATSHLPGPVRVRRAGDGFRLAALV